MPEVSRKLGTCRMPNVQNAQCQTCNRSRYANFKLGYNLTHVNVIKKETMHPFLTSPRPMLVLRETIVQRPDRTILQEGLPTHIFITVKFCPLAPTRSNVRGDVSLFYYYWKQPPPIQPPFRRDSPPALLRLGPRLTPWRRQLVPPKTG